jgi:hypothetical protein
MKTNKKHIDQFVKDRFEQNGPAPSVDLFSKIQKSRTGSTLGLSPAIKILIAVISITTILSILYIISTTKTQTPDHRQNNNTKEINQPTSLHNSYRTPSKISDGKHAYTATTIKSPESRQSSQYTALNEDKPAQNRIKNENIILANTFTKVAPYSENKQNHSNHQPLPPNQNDNYKTPETITESDTKNNLPIKNESCHEKGEEHNQNNKVKTAISIEILPFIGFNTNIGKFDASPDSPFYLQENALISSKTGIEYGVLLSGKYNNLSLETGLSMGQMNWTLDYPELPLIKDPTTIMEITQEEVWTINQITDTSGMVVQIDSVYSHTNIDTNYRTQYTNQAPPNKLGKVSVSYYNIPLQISWDFKIDKHSIQPYAGTSILIPYKASGTIRTEDYNLGDFNSKYKLNKTMIYYNLGIRYSYAITKRTGIYTSVNFRSSKEYLFSHDEINFSANQISIKAGIRYKLF